MRRTLYLESKGEIIDIMQDFFVNSIKIVIQSERLFYTAGKGVETINRLIVLEQNDCFYAVLGLEMKYVRWCCYKNVSWD